MNGRDDANWVDDGPTRVALRAATAASHARTHRIGLFMRLAEGTITQAQYRTLLIRLLGFHAPMEAAIAGLLDPSIRQALGSSWQRAHLLRTDLSALGPELPENPPMLAARHLPASPCQALGCLYVLEGSTLGGQFLARRLDTMLHTGPSGRSFLSAGAAEGHLGWRRFCGLLERWGAESTQRADMVAAAVGAFEAFECWFEDRAGLDGQLTGARPDVNAL